MIPNQWYPVLESREVKPGKPVGVMRFGRRLVLFRETGGAIACLQDRCPHRGASLSHGKVVDDHVQCPFHGLEFARDGRCVRIPANGKDHDIDPRYNARRYAVREANDFIWVFFGEADEAVGEPAYFDEVEDFYSYSTLTDVWQVHYSRVIENQLDAVHLPFVHASTIGRGNKTLVNGPVSEWIDGQLNIWVFNEVDTGQEPKKATALTVQPPPQLKFRYPNLWLNLISDKIKLVIAFVPIDEGRTKLYIRYYQRLTRVPGLKHLVTWTGKVGSFVIERQDKRVVETQRPIRSSLEITENLLPGDRPIVMYRIGRDALIKKEKDRII